MVVESLFDSEGKLSMLPIWPEQCADHRCGTEDEHPLPIDRLENYEVQGECDIEPIPRSPCSVLQETYDMLCDVDCRQASSCSFRAWKYPTKKLQHACMLMDVKRVQNLRRSDNP
jgi:hypothetical protein